MKRLFLKCLKKEILKESNIKNTQANKKQKKTKKGGRFKKTINEIRKKERKKKRKQETKMPEITTDN